MKSDKKKFTIFITLISIFFLMISASLVYAWIVYTKDTNKIDANTEGIKYVYEINDSKKLQSINYTISDLAFFDIDNEDEIEYFLDMACEVKIEVMNTGDIDFNYTISQTSGKYTNDNTAGVLCLFSTTQLTSVGSNATIQAMITASTVTESVTGSLVKYNTSTNTADTDTYYIYIIGVQTNDSENNDFLDDTYNFTITINATTN